MPIHPGVKILCALILSSAALVAEPVGGRLQKFEGCKLVEADWADGDSFPVRLPDGKEITVRLYGADCLEMHVHDDNDAQRLRTQRRYFGLRSEDPSSGIAKAKEFGSRAAAHTKQMLAKPFTIHTSFADGRGDARYQRFYAFVETHEGKDLASELVQSGLARAYGVFRATPSNQSAAEYKEQLKDLELMAAGNRVGIWAVTDWQHLTEERKVQRQEDLEVALATGDKNEPTSAVNPNTASRDELMSLPGIGESLANRIIQSRESGPFQSPEDLDRVPGLGPASIQKLAPYLSFP